MSKFQDTPDYIELMAKSAGLSKSALASKAGIAHTTVTRLGKPDASSIKKDNLDKLALAANYDSYEDFISAISEKILTVPLVGYVGAGGEVFPFDDMGDQVLDEVERPYGLEDTEGVVALKVRGDSMQPLIRSDWEVFYKRDYYGINAGCVGNLCVCETIDGQSYIKYIKKGSKEGLFHLVSTNADVMTDIVLKWCVPVLALKPKIIYGD